MTRKHPTLEGHPAWEAFKRAPLDPEPASEDELRDVEEARSGMFTKKPPHATRGQS